jgi:lipopolysaccharide export system protein LptA
VTFPPHVGLVLSTAATCATLLATAAGAEGQEGCEFGPGTKLYVQQTVPGSGVISHVTAPHFVCADGVEIWADSAVAYSELGMSHLMGSVRYLDRTRELRADTARYFSDQARLQASGHVFIRNEIDGSQVENGVLVYLRQAEFREEESMTVTTGPDGVRPRALVTSMASDSAAESGTGQRPYAVVGDRIDLQGDAYFRSIGNVEITRDSLFAYGDSAEFDQTEDRLVLVGSARIVSRGSELVGRTITMTSPGGDTSRIHADKDALLIGEGVRLTSPQIVVFLVDGALDRLVATPLARAGAGAEGQLEVAAERQPRATEPDSADLVRPVAMLDDAELTADSIDILAPGERVERVVAVGTARSVSTARDSLNVESLPDVARSDWLEGDTVIVTFRSLADSAAETATEPRDQEMESVAAHGGASALYRLTPSDTTARAGVDPPALHYVVGDRITITMSGGDVDDLHVVGQTRGVHLEPLSPRAAGDTLAADTLARDTLVGDTVPRDTLTGRDTVPGAMTDTEIRPDTRRSHGSERDRRRQSPLGTRPHEGVPSATRGRRRGHLGHPGRDRRPARAERGGKDDDLLHDRRADSSLRRLGAPRRRDHHAHSDVPSGPKGRGLSRSGALDLPQALGRGQRARHPRDPRSPSSRGEAATRGAARRARAGRAPQEQGLFSVGWRAAPAGDHARARPTP